jgi:hypothetical protein
MKFINTALAIGMLSDGNVTIKTLSKNEVESWLKENYEQALNACNPSHANTLDGISRVLGYDFLGTAKGERFTLKTGDECLVFALVPPPGYGRETREFTDDEIKNCKISYRLVKME